jgi:hypothetical protein
VTKQTQRPLALLREAEKLKRRCPLIDYSNGVPCLLRYLANLRGQLRFDYASYDMRYV